jgi:protein dithiol oxidoreductase (disulfide-forming)
MLRIKSLLIILITAALVSCAPQIEKKDGYHVMNFVDQPADQKPQVIEFFGYFCPHCYDLEETITKWKRLKSSKIEFIRIPVDFGKSQSIPAAKAYYVAEKFDLLDQLHQEFFKRFQVTGKGINGYEELVPYFVSNGVSKEKLEQAWNDSSIDDKVAQGRALVKKFQISSVPTFVINQKFKTSVEIAGDKKKLSRKLSELAIKNG